MLTQQNFATRDPVLPRPLVVSRSQTLSPPVKESGYARLGLWRMAQLTELSGACLLASGPGRFFAGEGKRPGTICDYPQKSGDTGYFRTLLAFYRYTVAYSRILPCTLVYTCNSNLVPNTSAVYFISTYTNDFTDILLSFSCMRERIAPGRFPSPKNGLGPRLEPAYFTRKK